MICAGNISLEATLDKTVYRPDQPIPVNICIQNNSNAKIKKIRVVLVQHVNVQMLQRGKYKRIIDENVSSKMCPIRSGGSVQTIMQVTASLSGNELTDGIALDGHHKKESADLASSTFLLNKNAQHAFGIIVSYAIIVQLYTRPLKTVVCANLPFLLLKTKADSLENVVSDASELKLNN